MKRWMALLLAAAMMICLAACGKYGSGGQEIQNPTGQGSTEMPDHKGSGDMAGKDPAMDADEGILDPDAPMVASVQLAVNPQLRVDMTEGGVVVCVEPLNEDGKTICSAVHVVGKRCEEAMNLLVGEMAAQKFLTDGKAIAITVVVTEAGELQMDQWVDRVVGGVTQALAECQINAQMIMDVQVDNSIGGGELPGASGEEEVPPIPEEMPSTEDPASPPAQHPTQETDHVGNTILWKEDGSIEVYDPQGNLIETRWEEADGSTKIISKDPQGRTRIAIRDDQGRETWVRTEELDGSWTEATMYPNGNSKTVIVQRADSYEERYYYENGNLKYITSQYGDTHHEMYCDERGIKYLEITQTSDYRQESTWAENGHCIEMTREGKDYSHHLEYHANGMEARSYYSHANGYSETIYSEDGKILETKGQTGNEGWHQVYNSDGTSYEYYYAPDGTVWYSEFDAAGNQLLETHKQVQ